MDELGKLKTLQEEGRLSPEEFEAEKAKLIAEKNGAKSRNSYSTHRNGLKLGIGVAVVALLGFGLWMMTSTSDVDSKELSKIIGKGYEAFLIPSGSFMMGCTSEQGSDCYDWEKPVHEVTISYSFYMMKSEVTQGLYKNVMGDSPWKDETNDCYRLGNEAIGGNQPAHCVSWFDGVKFANKLSKKEGLEECYTIDGENVSFKGLGCNGWRLPTEAEWEYAARGGQQFKYAGSNNPDEVAWYDEYLIMGSPHPICKKSPNGYGLCDMSGNVWEWVWDKKCDYSSSSLSDPIGDSCNGSNRVVRGGAWSDNSRLLRVSLRHGFRPSDRAYLGFRCVRSNPN